MKCLSVNIHVVNNGNGGPVTRPFQSASFFKYCDKWADEVPVPLNRVTFPVYIKSNSQWCLFGWQKILRVLTDLSKRVWGTRALNPHPGPVLAILGDWNATERERGGFLGEQAWRGGRSEHFSPSFWRPASSGHPPHFGFARRELERLLGGLVLLGRLSRRIFGGLGSLLFLLFLCLAACWTL